MGNSIVYGMNLYFLFKNNSIVLFKINTKTLNLIKINDCFFFFFFTEGQTVVHYTFTYPDINFRNNGNYT